MGAEILPGGATEFRVWAPAATDVSLVINPGPTQREVVLERPAQDGWHSSCLRLPEDTRYAYRLDGSAPLADPASRWNPEGVDGASVVLDARRYDWQDASWRGRPWTEAVLYEMHVGTFTPQGTFDAARARLPRLAEIGITCLEIMPIAQFRGSRNWGYDGALLFAPSAGYGAPDDVKAFVDAAHAAGLMVLLDVVYNHLGPGNPLGQYAPCFFSAKHVTPWGKALNFDGPDSDTVREFFIQNALYWLEEYSFDGLRLDAVQGMVDDSATHIVDALVHRVHERFCEERHVHIVLENERNEARYLRRNSPRQHCGVVSQWNDDVHHAAHVLLTGETDGYYVDYKGKPTWYLGRALAEGFAYQGEPSEHRHNESHGESSTGVSLDAFINFVQTHDQVANRPSGVRLVHETEASLYCAVMACLLLAPSPPLFFMGDEFASSSPFFYFCDFSDAMGRQVAEGRLKEFARFDRYKDPAVQATIPDPNVLATFERSKLNWSEACDASHCGWTDFYKDLLRIRRERVEPLMQAGGLAGTFEVDGRFLRVSWHVPDGRRLMLYANFDPVLSYPVNTVAEEIIYRSRHMPEPALAEQLLAHGVVVAIAAPGNGR